VESRRSLFSYRASSNRHWHQHLGRVTVQRVFLTRQMAAAPKEENGKSLVR
jgi:hypothetical protein